MKSYLQFIGAGAHDSGPMSLLLFFDDRRYLVNCAEGTQRAAILDAVRLAKVDACFATSLEWQRIGGLAGLMCTLRDQHEASVVSSAGVNASTHAGTNDGHKQEQQDSGEPLFNIFGPKGLCRLLEATHPFVRRQRFPCIGRELLPHNQMSYSDGFLTVRYIVLDPVDYPTLDGAPAKRMRSPPTLAQMQKPVTMAYMFCPPPIPGKFNVERAKALGLTPGPLFSELVKGKAVCNPDGVLVTPSDCVGPSIKHPYVVVCDLPSADHYSLFKEHCEKEWKDCLEFVEEIVIFTDNNIVDRSEMKDLFKKANCHLIIRNNQLVNVDQAEYLCELNSIHKCYRTPCFENHHECIKPFTKIHLFPTRSTESLHNINNTKPAQPLPLTTDKLRCSFLGTAAAIPGKYRNVSGILLHTATGFVIMDCGEGSVGQIARLYGEANLQTVLDAVSVLCLTHIHADHHLGAFSVMLMRSPSAPRLTVFAPGTFKPWFDEYEAASGLSLNIDFVSCSGNEEFRFNDILIRSFPVNHCPDAHGFRLDYNQESVVYSGDCRPSPTLTAIATNATIVIHEATMPDDLHSEAVARKHCTVSEAISVCRDCRCDYAVLTHVTQRYAKSFPVVPVGNDEVKVSFAADLMSFVVDDLPGLISVRLPSDNTIIISDDN